MKKEIVWVVCFGGAAQSVSARRSTEVSMMRDDVMTDVE